MYSLYETIDVLTNLTSMCIAGINIRVDANNEIIQYTQVWINIKQF